MIVTIKLPNSMDAVRLTVLETEASADVDICRYKDMEGLRVPLAQLKELHSGLGVVIDQLERRAQTDPQEPS